MRVFLRLVVLGVIALCAGNCQRSNSDVGPLSVSVSSDMICRANVPLKSNDPPSENSCVRYTYEGDSLLMIKHLNAGFNCCPEKFAADIEVKGDSLIIREDDFKHGCKCNCQYNLDILVHNLPADLYHVRIAEPYAGKPESRLIFDLDLKKEKTGEFCVTRGEGWWR